jgi:hypothetical protein
LRCRLVLDMAQRINGSETDPQDPDPLAQTLSQHSLPHVLVLLRVLAFL